jgi:hypothetical protein
MVSKENGKTGQWLLAYLIGRESRLCGAGRGKLRASVMKRISVSGGGEGRREIGIEID